MSERPDLVGWWAEAEAEAEARASKPSGARFRTDRPRYSEMLRIVQQSPELPGMFDENHGAIIDCMCTEGQDE